MTNEEKIAQLEKQLQDLKDFVYKDEYTTLKIFRKDINFKKDVTLNNIKLLSLTAGSAVIADGTTTFDKILNNSIAITTKNGIVTSISII
jgi:hypothetical protein